MTNTNRVCITREQKILGRYGLETIRDKCVSRKKLGWELSNPEVRLDLSKRLKKQYKKEGYHVLVKPGSTIYSRRGNIYFRRIFIKKHTPGTRWSKKI